MVRITHLDDAFSEFLNWKKTQKVNQSAAKRKEKEKKKRQKKFEISVHARADIVKPDASGKKAMLSLQMPFLVDCS